MDRPRRALRQGAPAATTTGDVQRAAQLAAALDRADPDADDELTHGFHSYPARMHFQIARGVLDAMAGSNTRVLDPFCGSGTVLVEALRRGLPAMGVDLSHIALRIAEVKCDRRDAASIAAFAELAAGVAERSRARVEGKVKVRAPLSADERAWYDPHVLLELAGLLAEINALPDGTDRRALQMVFSSLVVKFSRQRADTAPEAVQRSIPRGAPTEFFARKATELCRRWTELSELVSVDAPRVQLRHGDARKLTQACGPKRRFDLVLSSPPYGGTYDYVEHHRRRRAWLHLDAKDLDRGEIGARRAMTKRGALQRWDEEMLAVLTSVAGVLAEDAAVVWLVGDGEIGGTRLDAIAHLRGLVPRAGLKLDATASAPRRDFRGGPDRMEHLVLMRRR